MGGTAWGLVVTSFDEVAGGKNDCIPGTYVILALSHSFPSSLSHSQTHIRYTLSCKALVLPAGAFCSAICVFYIPTLVFLPLFLRLNHPAVSITHYHTPLQPFRCHPLQPLPPLFFTCHLLSSSLPLPFPPSSPPHPFLSLLLSVIGKGFFFFCQLLGLFCIVSTPPNSSLAFLSLLSLSLSSVHSPPLPRLLLLVPHIQCIPCTPSPSCCSVSANIY